MGVQRVRIDASLHAVTPVGITQISTFQANFRNGEYDYLAPDAFSQLSVAIQRARLLDTAAFNQELNSVLHQYGMWVTNIPNDMPEYAMKYLEGYQTQEALVEALQMRNWFIPAASSLHRVNPRHLHDVDDVLNAEAMSAC